MAMNLPNGKPERPPMVVRGPDLVALAERLESGMATEEDKITAARLARHVASIWLAKASVSLR